MRGILTQGDDGKAKPPPRGRKMSLAAGMGFLSPRSQPGEGEAGAGEDDIFSMLGNMIDSSTYEVKQTHIKKVRKNVTLQARPEQNPAPRSLRRVRLTPQVKAGSLYRCGRSI